MSNKRLSCEQMEQLAHLQYLNNFSNTPENLYHYTAFDVANLILSSEGIVFRLTEINCFSDITEGRLIQAYYEIALHNLKVKSIISSQEYERLIRIELPEETLIISSSNIGSYTKYRMFVACFSKEGQNEYMYNNYIKNTNHEGYCIQIPSYILNEKFKQLGIAIGCKLELAAVIYGNSIIEKIETYLIELKRICLEFSSDILDNGINTLLRDYLKHMKPLTKLERYKNENEVRLIVYLPIENNNTLYPDFIKKIDIANKSYIEICFDKCLYGLFSHCIPEEKKEAFFNELKRRSYPQFQHE